MLTALEGYLARKLGVPILRLTERPALEHQSNRLYDAWHGSRHLIVKEFLIPDEMAEAPVREYRALELLAPLDIAPRPVLYAPVGQVEDAGPVVVYEYMEGVMWDRAPRSAADLVVLADGWRHVNGLPADGLWLSRGQDRLAFRPFVERMQQHLLAYAAWAAGEFPAGCVAAEHFAPMVESAFEAVRRLGQLEPVLCFCRADPRFANVIARPDGRLGFVDWEDSGLRDPACDVADVMLHANQEDLVPDSHWRRFLDAYLPPRRVVDPTLDERIDCFTCLFTLYWLARQMAIGVKRAEEGRLGGWAINERPPNWRLRRYLARGLAWPRADFAAKLAAVQGLTFFPGID